MASDESKFLSVRTEEIERWMTGEDARKPVLWTLRLRAWVEGELYRRTHS